ncbi:MAG: peptidase M48 [Rhodospirillales bacterium]|nr:peptidase M48 [Rhodospirillales bacterium]
MTTISRLRRFVAAALAGAALLNLAACSVNPATGRQSFTGFMSREEELRIGAEEHPKILKQFGGEYADRNFDEYVARMGLALSKVSDVPDLPYKITVLNDDQVNAFALPGGYVYITRGLLMLAENEAEVAGVLSHEIGHVTARHTAERYSQAMLANIGLMGLGILGASVGVPGEAGQLASYGLQAAIMGFSREQELEADMLGVRYMTRAGYHPEGMTSFFQKLETHTKLQAAMRGDPQADQYNFMSSHPRTTDRIAQAVKLANMAVPPNARFERQAYLSRIDGLIFGDDPKQGVRKGRVFAHPDLRFQFTVPQGFTLFNSPTRVVALHPQGASIRFDMEAQNKARSVKSISAYLANDWGRSLSLKNVETISVKEKQGDMEGATAVARLQTKSGPADLRLVAIRGGSEQIFRFIFLTPPQLTGQLAAELQRTTYSLQRLTDEEAAAIKPLRIKVTTVQAGDTVEKLAERMAVEKFKVEWFELLNSVKRTQPLVPGTQVKIVVG